MGPLEGDNEDVVTSTKLISAVVSPKKTLFIHPFS